MQEEREQQQQLANGTNRQTDWSSVNWRKANRQVRNLRQRIFRASQVGDLKKVRSLQKLMLRSYSNTLMSVRRVTQLNAGKRTAGVDKLVVKTPIARGKLVDQLQTYQPWRARPARRVYIPKKGSNAGSAKANGKLRPLGIPTVIDRCLQAKVKNALEPFWEARFEGISYGFRPGRSCHDAMMRIYMLARPNNLKRWVVDADIKGAFDNIDHQFLLEAVGGFPARELIKQWLKAGYMESGVFHDTEAGTPQGGVISPLLANIALHGMEQVLGVKYRTHGEGRPITLIGERAVVRYADDFVVFCESREDAEEVVQILGQWLGKRGLTLSEEKTRIVHLTEGFDFLGFNIRHHKAPRTSKSGYKLLIRPSKKSVQAVRDKLREKWRRVRGQNARTVVGQLNPIIRGWANYFRTHVAKRTFKKLDHWMFQREIRYVNHAHPNKTQHWKKLRYWGKLNPTRNDTWVFGDKDTGHYLLRFNWFNIERHIPVRGTASPDDPSLKEYWRERDHAIAKFLPTSEQKIARNQNYVCRVCGMSLFNGEETQVHHREPKSRGGKDTYSNLRLTHLFCHQQLHSDPGDKAEKLLYTITEL
jgi:RNA-directed DNA polymerase